MAPCVVSTDDCVAEGNPSSSSLVCLCGVDANGELMYVKVMTDEQLETLRKQIAVYGTICEQLIEMHRTLSAQQDLAGTFFLLFDYEPQ